VTDQPTQQTQPPPPRAHQALYRRWRAQTFAQVVGQEAVVETLRNAVRTNRVAHAILFVGPRGTGKTSLARILAKAINCTNLQDGDPCDTCPSCIAIREGRAMDLIEIDAASNRGIDAIRDLRERVNYAPTDLRRKVYILDEAHQITKEAWNALLKSLEEPPDFVVFMFASTHPQEFPPAILSRLQRFDVRRLTTAEIEGKLQRILDADGRTATPDAIHLIARLAAGGMRDAESMLDQLLSSSADELDERRVRDLLGLADAETITGFVNALVASDALAGIRLLDALEERGRDLRGFLDQVIEALRAGIIGAAGTQHPVTALAAAARRLAAIDPSRAGVGGLRLQLELALFPVDGPSRPSMPAPEPVAPAAAMPAELERPAEASTPGRTAEKPSNAKAVKDVETEAPVVDAPELAAAPRAKPDEKPAAEASKPSAASATPAATSAKPGAAPAKPEARTGQAASASAKPEAAPAKPEAAPAKPEAPSATVAGPPTGDLAILRDRWAEVVARISANPPTKPLIAECRPVSVEDGVVTLGFPENKAFLKDLLEKRRTILEEHIGAVLGRSVAVRCVATNIDVLPDLPTDDEAAWILAEARRIFGEEGADPAEVG
jgi:DNA polymerase-3 subunit gamma/tau